MVQPKQSIILMINLLRVENDSVSKGDCIYLGVWGGGNHPCPRLLRVYDWISLWWGKRYQYFWKSLQVILKCQGRKSLIAEGKPYTSVLFIVILRWHPASESNRYLNSIAWAIKASVPTHCPHHGHCILVFLRLPL